MAKPKKPVLRKSKKTRKVSASLDRRARVCSRGIFHFVAGFGDPRGEAGFVAKVAGILRESGLKFVQQPQWLDLGDGHGYYGGNVDYNKLHPQDYIRLRKTLDAHKIGVEMGPRVCFS